MTRFATLKDALAAGYIKASRRNLETYRGCTIKSIDISKPAAGFIDARGYDFAIVAEIPGDLTGSEWGWSERSDGILRDGGNFGESTSLWLHQDLNRMRQPGCVSMVYAPETYATAMSAARAWIDQYLDAHPDAVERQRQAQAATWERALRRSFKRCNRLAEKGLI